MIIFDKIKQLLFTEVEEVEYLEENESNKKTELTPVSQPKQTQPKPVQVVTPKVEVSKEMRKEPSMVNKPKVKQDQKSPFDIKADFSTTEKKVEKRLKPIERKDIEIPQVISPINGIKGENKVDENGFVTASTPKSRKSKDSLGTVISPYYGEKELDDFQAKAQVEIASDKLAKESELFIEEETMENISLDQIVTTQEEDDEEMVQFSLFGDNAPLKELNEDEESLEHSFDDESDDLPF